MIVIRFPTFPVDGELQWGREECVQVPGQTLDVYLGIGGDLIERLVINGEIVDPDSLDLCTPNDGDEITVVPKVAGSNKGIIVGVLGAIAAIAFAIPTGGASLAWFLASGLSIGLTGFAVATLIYSLAHPARSAHGDKTGNTYTFDGITNADQVGVAQPVVLGDVRTGGVRIDSFLRVGMFPDPDNPGQTKQGTRSYQLINVSKARYGIEGISEVRANDEPIANFHGTTWAYTKGETPEQWYDGATDAPIGRPEGFDVSANTFTQSQELTTTPYVYTSSATSNIDAIEAIVVFPAGLVHTHKGSDSNNSTTYRVQYKLHSSGTWLPCAAAGFDAPTGVRTVKGKTHAPLTEAVRIPNLTPGRYDIELTWLVSDYTSPSGEDVDAWKAFLIGVTEIVSNAQPKPGYSLLAVSALAIEQLNGAPPIISCRCKGIKVPWWDGSAWQAPTWVGPDPSTPIGRCPGWTLLEVYRDGDDPDSGYEGWGLGLPDTAVHLPSWKTFAEKCNKPISAADDQGNTWLEPMHQLDTTLNEQRPLDTLMREILGSYRAAPIMAGNGAQHGVFYDDADDPAQLVTMGNMVSGSFQPVYDFSPRTNTFDVTFRDRDHDFATVTRTIANDPLVTRFGTRRESLAMSTVTRWSEVHRTSFYNLKKHQAAKVPLQFEMATDAILWRIGQVINVQHREPGWGIDGGRVRLGSGVAPNTNTLTRVITPLRARTSGGFVYVIDNDGSERLIDLAALNYEVRVRLADGSGEEGQRRDVSSVAVSSDGYLIVTTSVPFTAVPQYNDPIAFGEIEKSIKPYRCLAISLGSNATRRVSCIDYNASVYDPTGPLETINYSSLPLYGGPPPPIPAGTCVAVEDLSAQNTNVALSTVIVQWQEPIRAAGYGFYDGADVEVSEDAGASYKLLAGRARGTEYRWHAAPHEIALLFRVTPVSSAGRTNMAGRVISNALVCHGSQAVPANVSGFTATVEGDSFVYRWADISREMQYEIRDISTGFGTADSHRVFIGRATEFKIIGPPVVSKTLYIKAFQPMASAGTSTPIYSAAAVSATASKVAPSPPTVGTRVSNKDTIKIPVGAASGADVTGIRLWASQTNGFIPSTATQVAQIIPASGGDFIFHVTTAGTWYFKIAATDALTDRLGDYSYSSQFTSSVVTITPQNPSAVVFSENSSVGRPRAVSPTAGAGNAPQKIFSLFVNWTFIDNVNPSGHLRGFQVVVYATTGGTPIINVFDSGLLPEPAQRSCGIDGLTISAAANYTAAVRAIYVDDDLSSSWVTSSGLALDPVTGEPILQNSDDRNISSFGESFEGATVPAGFTKASTDSIVAALSALFVTPTNVASSWVQWDLRAWGNAKLDTQRGSSGFRVLIAMSASGATAANHDIPVTYDNGSGVLTTRSFRFDPSFPIHTYVVDFRDKSLTANLSLHPTIKIDASGLLTSGGSSWYIDGIIVSFDDLSMAADGHIARALYARDQFDRDPVYGGFFGHAPTRHSNDPDSSIQVYDSNGIFVVDINGVDFGYRRGRQGRISDVFNTTVVTYGLSTGRFLNSPLGDVTPVIPAPYASNKARIALSAINGGHMNGNTPAAYPITEYIEATEISMASFNLAVAEIHGGTQQRSTTVLPSGSSSISGRALTLSFPHSPFTTTSSDAYAAISLITSGANAIPTSGAFCFRAVIWLKVTMPSVLKTTGSFYSVDLQFYVSKGVTSTGATPMQLDNADQTGPYAGRFLTDGFVDYYPIVISGVTTNPISGTSTSHNYQAAQNFKVDWTDQTNETGAGTVTPTVELDRVDVDYITGYTQVYYPGNRIALDFIYAEEF